MYIKNLDIKEQTLDNQEELLDLINLQNMVSDFVYIRDTLKENTENGKKLINSISLSILDVDMENSAELISAFSELNRTLTENMKLYISSYKELSNIILNLNKVKEPKQVTNNHLNISTVNNIENSDQVPISAISTADLLEQLRGLELELQKVFELQEGFKKNGKTYRKIEYIADFMYCQGRQNRS